MNYIQFCCGTNLLKGWDNRDSECDVTKPLPDADASVDAVMVEHGQEHLTIHEAYSFLAECRRILRPGGLLRVTVPSIEKVRSTSNKAYEDFCFKQGWAYESSRAAAIHSLIFQHGHKSTWSQSLLNIYLEIAGFTAVQASEIHHSRHPVFEGVNGHHKVIGEEFNTIESVVAEGMKPIGVEPYRPGDVSPSSSHLVE